MELQNIELKGKQRKIKEKAVNWYLRYRRGENDLDEDIFFPIAGYAGTGKSTLISFIVKEIEDRLDMKLNIKYVAYTGKAALVMRSKGSDATTLHKLIKIPDTIYNEKKDKTELLFRNRNKEEIRELNKKVDLVIIDEGSMVPEDMIRDLKRDYGGIRFIVLGDPAQLPPVGGKLNTLFRDLEDNMILDEIHRQEGGSPIIDLSKKIREMKSFDREISKDLKIITEKEYKKFAKRFEKEGEGLFLKDGELRFDQIIVRYNRTRQHLNKMIRKNLGFTKTSIESGKSIYLPQKGDKMLCFQNNSRAVAEGESGNKYMLINGMIGICDSEPKDIVKRGTDKDGNDIITFRVDFRADYGEEVVFKNLLIRQCLFEKYDNSKIDMMMYDGERVNYFSYGYSLTSHKAQGSEWDYVLVVNEIIPFYRWVGYNLRYNWFKYMIFGSESAEEAIEKVWAAYRHECRAWLYTAVTRAKKKLVLATDLNKRYGYGKARGSRKVKNIFNKRKF